MKSTIFLILLLTASLQILSQSFYDLNAIQEIRITFPFSNWDQKLDSLHSVDTDARLIATKVELNGITFDSVGIRYKGNSTYNPNRLKNPLNIKLDFIRSEQNYQGYNTIKLSNGFMDPSFLREVMGYKICRQYLPASLANFINVYVNNVLIGLYTNVQDIDNDFLSDHFFSTSNAFFQCDRADKQVSLPGTCLPSNVGSALKYTYADSTCYYNNYELESSHGWTSLLRLMKTLNQDPLQVENYLDVDRALWMLALNNFYVNLDSYSGSGHNYLVYENNLQRFNTILWDLNEFYGAFTNAGTGPQLTVTQMQQLDPLLHLNNAERPLISKLLGQAKWKKRYLAHLFTVLSDAEATNAYEQDGLELQNLIRNAVTADVNKLYSLNGFNANLYNDFTNTGGMGGKTYPGLISFTNARINFLKSHAALNVTKPFISNIEHSPREINKQTDVSITAEITATISSKLFYRFSKEERFLNSEMFDDGLHNDGAAGDGVYGAMVNMQGNTELQYYIYSENDNIASLSPARAEYEFYSLQVRPNTFENGNILLNELMASNTSYKTDESGDYDDWFELYNTTDTDLSCFGLYATDNHLNKLKWAFPDTIIRAKSFLVVWADENGNDPGLHANFKLSKSGELIQLYTSDSVLLDEVDFPVLDDNKSYGRCEGKWAHTKSPTFAMANDCIVTNTRDFQTAKPFAAYPNPFDEFLKIILLERPTAITISDILGKVVYTKSNPDTDQLEINTIQWLTGTYLLKLNFPDFAKSSILLKL